MSDFAIALKARLLAAPQIGTSEIHWTMVPQGTPLDYIRLQVISDPRPEHLKGYDGGRETRVQADCFATSWGRARAMAAAIIAAIEAPGTFGGIQFGHGRAEGPRDLGEDTAKGFVFRASTDLLVWHLD